MQSHKQIHTERLARDPPSNKDPQISPPATSQRETVRVFIDSDQNNTCLVLRPQNLHWAWQGETFTLTFGMGQHQPSTHLLYKLQIAIMLNSGCWVPVHVCVCVQSVTRHCSPQPSVLCLPGATNSKVIHGYFCSVLTGLFKWPCQFWHAGIIK